MSVAFGKEEGLEVGEQKVRRKSGWAGGRVSRWIRWGLHTLRDTEKQTIPTSRF